MSVRYHYDYGGIAYVLYVYGFWSVCGYIRVRVLWLNVDVGVGG